MALNRNGSSFPFVGHMLTPALLEVLSAMYPDRCARPTDADREIWMAAGRRQVVDFLLEQHRRSQTVSPDAKIAPVTPLRPSS